MHEQIKQITILMQDLGARPDVVSLIWAAGVWTKTTRTSRSNTGAKQTAHIRRAQTAQAASLAGIIGRNRMQDSDQQWGPAGNEFFSDD